MVSICFITNQIQAFIIKLERNKTPEDRLRKSCWTEWVLRMDQRLNVETCNGYFAHDYANESAFYYNNVFE
jgi:hypothetical protein